MPKEGGGHPRAQLSVDDGPERRASGQLHNTLRFVYMGVYVYTRTLVYLSHGMDRMSVMVMVVWILLVLHNSRQTFLVTNT